VGPDSGVGVTVLVITGTDTGVGKTIATAALAAALAAEERSVAVYKPVQAGTEDGDGDIDVVARLVPNAAVHEGIRLPYPMAPVAAAARAGVPLPLLQQHVDTVRRLQAQYDDVLVEGAGGLLVELDHDGHTVADLALALHASTVVVCRSGLGTLNHTALTLEALARRGVAVAGLVIGSWPRRPTEIDLGNRKHLEQAAPLLAALPEGAGTDSRFDDLAPQWFRVRGGRPAPRRARVGAGRRRT
jgi:dethiobiotin synthase